MFPELENYVLVANICVESCKRVTIFLESFLYTENKFNNLRILEFYSKADNFKDFIQFSDSLKFSETIKTIFSVNFISSRWNDMKKKDILKDSFEIKYRKVFDLFYKTCKLINYDIYSFQSSQWYCWNKYFSICLF